MEEERDDYENDKKQNKKKQRGSDIKQRSEVTVNTASKEKALVNRKRDTYNERMKRREGRRTLLKDGLLKEWRK